MKTHKTNIEFLTHWMTFSRTGAMAQLFVLQSLLWYSETVLKNQDKLRKDMANNFIHPEAWIATAKEFQAEYAKNYEQPAVTREVNHE